jgi:uncharacterized phage protein gp47/JayE
MAITRYELPTVDSLRARYCEDVRRGKQKAGVTRPNVAAGSEVYVRAESLASIVFELHAKNSALQDATMGDKAIDDDLIRLCAIKGITPSNGAGAQGSGVANCVGLVTYPTGLECKTSDGLRYTVVASIYAASGASIPLIGVDTGKRTDKPAGTILTWTSPPAGSAATVVVGPGGLTNGTDADTTASLRRKLQDRERNPAASGSWAHYCQWAEGNTGVEKAFCYPAVRGPSTVDMAITIPADRDNTTGAYTRQATTALINAAGILVVNSDPEHADVFTTGVVNESVDTILQITIPMPVGDGGQSGGWIDDLVTRWPYYTGGAAVHLDAAPTSATLIRVDSTTGGTPTVESHIAIWSNAAKKFVHSRVQTVTLVAGSVYDLTLYDPIDTSIIASGDYVSPDAQRLDDYGRTIAELFAGLGPGEKAEIRGVNAVCLPRSYRHPFPADSWPSAFTSKDIGKLSTLNAEVSHVTPVLPTLPKRPTVDGTTPRILVLGKLALYPT